MTIVDLLAAIVTVVVLCYATAARPTHARCPDGYDLRTGVRSTGRFDCWPHVVGDPEWDGTWHRPELGVQPPGVIGGRVYCTGGSTPRQDGVNVWCQR